MVGVTFGEFRRPCCWCRCSVGCLLWLIFGIQDATKSMNKAFMGSCGSDEWRPSIFLPGAASDMMEEFAR